MSDGYQLKYKYSDPDNFWKLFGKLKNQHPFISSSYSPQVLDYFRVRALDSGYEVIDKSCILTFNDIPYSGFLGGVFVKEDFASISFFEIPCLAIDSFYISLKQKKQIHLFLRELLSLDFNEFKIRGANCSSSLPSMCDYLLTNSLVKLSSLPTRLIDLKHDESELKRSLRKSYHSLINWGLREMDIQIYDQSNISWKIISQFRDLHIQEAGKETRSIRTWEKQFEAIASGAAFCITAILNKELVSAAYFSCSDRHCYYGSSASRRELFDKPISHALIWKAILEAKRLGALVFETGSTFVETINPSLSIKEKNISYFKQGFGGDLIINNQLETF